MVSDNQTNHLYLADSLPIKYPNFYNRFEKTLKECGINFKFLPGTKDIWAVDYMPVQIEKNKFVQFVYNPDYLQSKKERKTISDVDAICKNINVAPLKTKIVVDGGNVSRTTDKVIMTDKVFKENRGIERKQLIQELKNFFQVDKVIFIPQEKGDFTGHADGMLRFYDNDTVLVNDYSLEKKEFQSAFHKPLKVAGLNVIEIPYCPYDNKSYDHANGAYINYLQMDGVIILPTFEMKQDEKAAILFEQLFKGQTIATIESNEIAYQGGVINCISWNIKK